MPSRAAQCLAAGAAAYLLKPLDEQTLLDAIAKATEIAPDLPTDER